MVSKQLTASVCFVINADDIAHENSVSILMSVRKKVVSPYVQGCLPRNAPKGNIVLPASDKDGLVTHFIPYYMAVSTDNKGVKNPKEAVPRYGFGMIAGTRFREQVKKANSSAMLNVSREFNAAPYNGAKVLMALAELDPNMTTSKSACQHALRTCKPNKDDTAPLKTLDGLSDPKEYSTCLEVVSGHTDAYGEKGKVAQTTFQSKMSFPLGTADQSKTLKDYIHVVTSTSMEEPRYYWDWQGQALPGALVYPRLKVATVCFALSDIELHCLGDEMHFGAKQEGVLARYRGAWMLKNGARAEEAVFYPEGCGQCSFPTS